MTRLRPLFAHLLPISIGSVIVGIILVLIAELGDVHALRIFGALLITNGGLGIGAETGLADPRKLRVPSWMRDWRAFIGLVAGLLAVIPVVIVLAMGLGGIFGEAADRSSLMLALGALVLVVLAVSVLLTGIVSLRAILRAANQNPAEQGANPHEIAEASKE